MARVKSRKTVKKTSVAANAQVGQITKKITELNRKIGLTYQVTEVAVAVLLTILVLQFRYLLIPAEVNGTVIPSWQYVNALHQSAGRDVLNQLIVENLIRQKAKESNFVVSSSDVDAEMAGLEEQFAASGGLDSILAVQGMSRDDLRAQMELNLMVEGLLADEVSVTDEEVEEYYTNNAELYEAVSGEEARAEIRAQLRETKLQQQVGTWIQDLQATAEVKVFLPGFEDF